MIEKINTSDIVDARTREVAQKVNETIDYINDRDTPCNIDVSYSFPKEIPECAPVNFKGNYSIEPHGNWYVLYFGADDFHHGFNLCSLTDFDLYGQTTRKDIVDALNGHKKILDDLDNKKISKRKIINYLQKALSSINDIMLSYPFKIYKIIENTLNFYYLYNILSCRTKNQINIFNL